ncbi:MAG: MurR/RpiR family transcriptional regulator [Pseudomonadota bacterium]
MQVRQYLEILNHPRRRHGVEKESKDVPTRKRPTFPDPAAFNELRARIVERYPQLSPQQQQIATYALDHPETMAMETAEHVARRLAVQPSALVRFAQALDYRGFRELRQGFKAHLMLRAVPRAPRRSGVSSAGPADLTSAGPVDRGPGAIAVERFAHAIDELERLQPRLDGLPFAAAVALLRDARSIHVTAQHLAYPFAALLAWLLIQAGRQCLMLDNTGGYALPQAAIARPDDLLVAISVAPYQPSVVQAAGAHRRRGGDVLAITDTALSPLGPCSTILLELPRETPNGRPPLVGLACIVQALVEALEATSAAGAAGGGDAIEDPAG